MRTKHLFTGATIPQIVLIDPRPALHTINASFQIMFAPSRSSRKNVPGELSTTPKRESIYPSLRRLRGRRGIDDQARADFACDQQAASRNAADPDSRVDRLESQQPQRLLNTIEPRTDISPALVLDPQHPGANRTAQRAASGTRNPSSLPAFRPRSHLTASSTTR